MHKKNGEQINKKQAKEFFRFTKLNAALYPQSLALAKNVHFCQLPCGYLKTCTVFPFFLFFGGERGTHNFNGLIYCHPNNLLSQGLGWLGKLLSSKHNRFLRFLPVTKKFHGSTQIEKI